MYFARGAKSISYISEGNSIIIFYENLGRVETYSLYGLKFFGRSKIK